MTPARQIPGHQNGTCGGGWGGGGGTQDRDSQGPSLGRIRLEQCSVMGTARGGCSHAGRKDSKCSSLDLGRNVQETKQRPARPDHQGGSRGD